MPAKACFALFLLLASPAVGQLFDTGLLVVRDGNGQVVGPVVDMRDDFLSRLVTTVFVNDMPHFLELRQGTPSILRPAVQNGVQVVFTSADCSGQPYLVRGSLNASFVPISYPINDPGLTLYVRAANVTVQTLTTQSALVEGGGCTLTVPAARDVVESVPVDTGMVPPYSLGRGPSLEVMGAALAAIPTLSGWGQLLLVLLLTTAGLFLLAAYRRRLAR